MFACCSRDVKSSRVEITNEAKSIASTEVHIGDVQANGILSYEHSDVPMSSTNDASENHELPIVDDGGDGVVDCEDDDDDGNEGGGYGDGGGDDGDDDDDDNDVDDDDDEDDNEGGGDGDGGDDDDGGGVTDKEVCPSSSSEHVNNSWKNLANFMKKHNLTDSAGDELIKQKRPTPVSTAPGPAPLPEPEALQAIRKGERKRREKVCIVASPEDSASDEADECVIPIFNEFADAEFPGFVKPCFVETVRQARVRFVKTPGLTKLACHQIDTVGSPARVPPRGMPAHFQQEAQEQMNDMRKKGIIVESSSSWLAPAVYTRKKTDFQDRLSGATVFSKLDLQCGYWQVPVDPKDQEKTAFSPGPGMGLFQFTRMPCGLMWGTQHIPETHGCGDARTAIYSSKVEVVVNWPWPKDEAEVRRFLGLASYYCKYIDKFADIAAPLHELTQKDTPFQWTQKSKESFQRLKACLTEAPVLAYPWFVKHASAMVLQTDASSVGLGAVLEQDQRVVGYASRTLTKAEANYSVIQRESLAIVWAMKQFRHYLLGRTFQLMTDHAPLQWLGEQKMEGLLCRWALAIQEFSFEIVYRKGTTNGNADALLRRRGPDRETLHAALTTVHASFTAKEAQQQDKTTLQLYNAFHSEQRPPHRDWKKPPLRRYAQLWSQRDMVDGIVCRKYHPGPTSDTLVVPVLPEALHQQALSMCHDSQATGHQGTHKTLERIRQEAYWVNMAQDVERHCRECVTCQ
ncbi:hypothetical protein EMCRGX_G030807 [Ephydatia muelleri]